MLTLQMIQLMDILWKQEGLDLRLGPILELLCFWASPKSCAFEGDPNSPYCVGWGRAVLRRGETGEGREGSHAFVLLPSASLGPFLVQRKLQHLFSNPHPLGCQCGSL